MSGSIGTTTKMPSQEDASRASDIVLNFLKQQNPGEYLSKSEFETMTSLLLKVKTDNGCRVSSQSITIDTMVTDPREAFQEPNLVGYPIQIQAKPGARARRSYRQELSF
jgi:hypothetical protein